MCPISATALLQRAGLAWEPFTLSPGHEVLLTEGHQLMAPYGALKAAQAGSPPYRGWHAHHVVEYQDLQRLAVASLFPTYEEQLCVLLPERAHVGRINSVLRRLAPIGTSLSAKEYVAAYATAYATVGDYCGGAPGAVKRELMAIVKATFRTAGIV